MSLDPSLEHSLDVLYRNMVSKGYSQTEGLAFAARLMRKFLGDGDLRLGIATLISTDLGTFNWQKSSEPEPALEKQSPPGNKDDSAIRFSLLEMT